MATLTQPVTADNFLEFAHAPGNDDRFIELVAGEIINMPLADRLHGQVLGQLCVEVGSYVYDNLLDTISLINVGIVLERSADGRDTVRGLDLALVSRERLPDLKPTLLDIAPELGIEVMSPFHEACNISLKVRQLLDAGTREVWVVYPDTRSVVVHRLAGVRVYREGDTLCGGDILPGFEIAVADIFPR